ncbi:SpoIIE family protein phosphatase [Streptomyces sp. E11-3]|uniref:SpoIIE family protein phosphatase n=1 Tax=Streptomyces sp. E11-3 TaxID=3110112 RepID=UPI00397EB9F1
MKATDPIPAIPQASGTRQSTPVIVTDVRGRIVAWSPGAQQLLGYTGREAVGWHLSALLAADIDPAPSPVRTTAAEATTLRHRDGSRIPVTLQCIPVTDGSGRTQHVQIARARPRHGDPYAATSADQRVAALMRQRSLLPAGVPHQTAVDAAFRHIPSAARPGVGGDWIDVISLSGARVALVSGNTAGHGLTAAAAMGRLRSAVRTLADLDLPPEDLLTNLDDLVRRYGTAGRDDADADTSRIGASCLFVVYDPVLRTLSGARAGHPPPALLSPDGGDGVLADLDIPAGPPLGQAQLPYEATELALAEGSTLLLYSDSLLTNLDEGREQSYGRLRGVLRSPPASSGEICDIVIDTLVKEPPVDDIALLVARTHGMDENQVATLDLPHDPAAVADARAWTGRLLATWGLDDLAFVTELVVSELVTNAIRYGHPPVQLRVLRDTMLIVEVFDGNSTAPHLRHAQVFDERGRGLMLVAQLTDQWGTRHSHRGKTIWCEQRITSARAAG